MPRAIRKPSGLIYCSPRRCFTGTPARCRRCAQTARSGRDARRLLWSCDCFAGCNRPAATSATPWRRWPDGRSPSTPAPTAACSCTSSATAIADRHACWGRHLHHRKYVSTAPAPPSGPGPGRFAACAHHLPGVSAPIPSFPDGLRVPPVPATPAGWCWPTCRSRRCYRRPFLERALTIWG